MEKIRLVGIPLTNRCNLHCEFCFRNDNSIRHSLYEDEDMPISRVQELSGLLRQKVEFINISAGYGEMLLYPYLDEALQILSDAKLKIIGYSNGMQLSDSSFDVRHFYRLLFSVNNNGSLPQIMDFVLRLNDSERRNIRFTLILDYCKNHCEYILDVLSFCKKVGICMELTWYNGTANHLRTNAEKIKKTMQRLASSGSEGVDVSFPPQKYYPKNRCSFWKDSLYFTKEGYLRDCCIYYRRSAELNIFRDSLDSIINSPYVQNCKTTVSNGTDLLSQCAYCPLGHGNIMQGSY